MPVSKKIVLDTNFLLIPGQFGVDIFSEIERVCPFRYALYVVDSTLGELEDITRHQKGRHKEAAQLALSLIRSKSISVIETEEPYTDRAIQETADSDAGNTIVATQDRELRKKLSGKGVRLITLRQKKYLSMEEIS